MRPSKYKLKRLSGRSTKKRANHEDLLMHLKTVFDERTPEHWRESLSRDLYKLTRVDPIELQGRRMGFRAVSWIFTSLWSHLPIEESAKVRCSLLRLAKRLIYRDPFCYSHRAIDDAAVTAVVETLEQPYLTMQERDRCLDLLSSLVAWNGVEDGETSQRLVRLVLRIFEQHRTGETQSVRTLRRAANCLRDAILEPYPSASVDAVLNHPHMLPFIFDELKSAEGRLHSHLSLLLSTILEHTTQAERDQLIAHNVDQLTHAFHQMRPIDLNGFTMHLDFAKIIAHSPNLVDELRRRVVHDCPSGHEENGGWNWQRFQMDQYCQTVVNVLDGALATGDDQLLQHLLGYGLLKVAAHFASNPHDFNTRRVTVFSRILSARPEWRAAFRKITEGGAVGNLVADYGRSIGQKITRSAHYVFNDFDY